MSTWSWARAMVISSLAFMAYFAIIPDHPGIAYWVFLILFGVITFGLMSYTLCMALWNPYEQEGRIFPGGPVGQTKNRQGVKPRGR